VIDGATGKALACSGSTIGHGPAKIWNKLKHETALFVLFCFVFMFSITRTRNLKLEGAAALLLIKSFILVNEVWTWIQHWINLWTNMNACLLCRTLTFPASGGQATAPMPQFQRDVGFLQDIAGQIWQWPRALSILNIHSTCVPMVRADAIPVSASHFRPEWYCSLNILKLETQHQCCTLQWGQILYVQ
jgi:hypothetical protein